MKYPARQTTERRISALLRVVLAVLLLLLNVGAVVLLAYYLRAHAAIAFVILELIAVAVAVNIQSSSVSSSYKLVWTLLVVALPVAGLILYVLWGGNIQNKRLNLLPTKALPCKAGEKNQSASNIERMGAALPNWSRLAHMLNRKEFLLCKETDVTYFSGGDAFFEDALKRMAQAEQFIFIEFFILAEGKLFDRLLKILLDRAGRGVEVKIIYDDFGSLTRMRSETVRKMREAGIEIHVFNPVHQYVNRLCFNYRDHRKLICVDGQYAYTGGINVADEYVGYVRRFGEWKDSGLLLDGMGAWGLTSRFIHMWEMLGGRMQNEHDYYRPLERKDGHGWCQSFAVGPLDQPDNLAEDLFFHCITNARRSIWITTPYFAVEDSMVRALCAAADGGVDVRLLLPGIPDHKYTQIVARSRYERLLEHGVKVYEFTPGFLHAKSFLVDDELAFLGTVNMDYRSFHLHYECGVMLYQVPALQEIRRDMEDIMVRSKRLEAAAWGKRSRLRRILEKLLRVFSIWM